MPPKSRVDWLGLSLAIVLCVLALYTIGWIPPIQRKEPFVASAGSGVMVPPSKIKCTKVGLNAVAAASMVQSGGKTWLCEDMINANLLIAGDTVAKMAYLSRNDVVCISQDASGTMYTCMDPSLDPMDESPDNQYMNYETACNAFYSKYMDISNALTTLQKMLATITSNQSSLNGSKKMLDDMYTDYKCATGSNFTNGQKKVCNAILQSKTALATGATKSASLNAILMDSITPAINSRAGIVKTLREYHCNFVLPVV